MNWSAFFAGALKGAARVAVVGSIIALIFVAAQLAGCAAPPPRVVVQSVDVPVPIVKPCPAPSVPARPHLPIADLAPDAAPKDVALAYVATVATLEGYAAQLEKLLGH